MMFGDDPEPPEVAAVDSPETAAAEKRACSSTTDSTLNADDAVVRVRMPAHRISGDPGKQNIYCSITICLKNTADRSVHLKGRPVAFPIISQSSVTLKRTNVKRYTNGLHCFSGKSISNTAGCDAVRLSNRLPPSRFSGFRAVVRSFPVENVVLIPDIRALVRLFPFGLRRENPLRLKEQSRFFCCESPEKRDKLAKAAGQMQNSRSCS